MKKILCLIACCFSMYYAQAQVATAAAIAQAIKWAVGTTVVIYSNMPNAEYTVEFKGSDGVSYAKVGSANEAILAAVAALENGAEYAHIRSQYPTVHPSCRNNRYTRRDISYLRSRL